MQPARTADPLRRPWAVWLALCVAVLGALAPPLSHALHATRGQSSQWVEICTSNGPRWMALGQSVDTRTGTVATDASPLSGSQSSVPDTPAMLEHCPFCLLSFDRLAPLPNTEVHFFTAPGKAVLPPAQSTFCVVATFSPLPPSRGPPAIS